MNEIVYIGTTYKVMDIKGSAAKLTPGKKTT